MPLQPDPQSFSLRPALQQDKIAIRRLIQEARINPTALDWRRFLLAVNSQGEMIGCGQVKPHRDGSRELASIAVRRAWRGQGVASAIIRALVEDHPGRLYLTCRANLGPFYERFGFRVIEPLAMPIYFRRIWRLARLAHALHVLPERLLVMERSG